MSFDLPGLVVYHRGLASTFSYPFPALERTLSKNITIGNAQGFWGDSPSAPARLVAQYPQLDYLTLDYLAEVSLSIMALQRSRNPEAGYARDFIGVVKSLAPHWQAGGKTRVVCNAGGLAPEACAMAVKAALAEAGLPQLRVALVTGDDALARLKADATNPDHRHWETGQSLSDVAERLDTANAYIGAGPVAEALSLGADIVVTGRVADPSLTLGICMHEFGWAPDDWNRLAAGTVAGHVLECGAQACGGISTNWLDLHHAEDIGFPIVEVSEDGTFVVTKPSGTGGVVNIETVSEQLIYEIGDPNHYISPDCMVDFTALRLELVGPDRVRVSNAVGAPPTPHYKVSATYRDGYWAQAYLTIVGRDAVKKAQRSGAIILERLHRTGCEFSKTNIECLGANAAAGGILPQPEGLLETVLRVSVAAPTKDAVERFAQEIFPLVTAGAQGSTGYAGGRPSPTPVFAYWPCLIEKKALSPTAKILT